MPDTESGAPRWLALQEQANELQREHPDWRRGQALFNALHKMHPDLANQIRGTSADPFHDDSRVQEFARAVMNYPPGPERGGDSS